jgi:hypothetical protein
MGTKGENMKSGAERIVEERKRQIESEGWDKEHDAIYKNNELVKAAVCYALPRSERTPLIMFLWPWNRNWWKPTPKNRIRELEKAGALIASEIDRIQNDE